MEILTSRKNHILVLLKSLQADADVRRKEGLFVCDGMKNLKEAISAGSKIRIVLWKGEAANAEFPADTEQYVCPPDVFDSVAAAKNSPGPLFAAAIPESLGKPLGESAVVLENVQDPGNVGTVIRTANAFRIDDVILCGACADLYNPKTVRATMGAIFRQSVRVMTLAELKSALVESSMKLYGAALKDDAEDIRNIEFSRCAVGIGSEGSGLTDEFLELCDKTVIIPMNPMSESLNAGVAASICMWELNKNKLG